MDSETYPVADALALAWYTGMGREAASERWAFAFSAKKKWRDKVRSDIAKISTTGRGYTKAFFITNQYIRDKSRGEIEDELTSKYGIDVRVLDRTWILDRVFQNHHEQLATGELGITTATRREVRRGPLDVQREQDLEAVQERVTGALSRDARGFALVDDCLEAAVLARELERPRHEIDGLFERADRVASQAGTERQRVEIAYQRAWTAVFWFEDFEVFNQLYGAVEARAHESRNVYDLERLTNLWLLLRAAVDRSDLDVVDAQIDKRTTTLTEALLRLRAEEGRASTSLQAKTLLLQMRLVASPPADAEPILHELTDVVRASEGLIGYPLLPLSELLGELGSIYGESPAYGDLFETVLDTTTRRAGDIAGAKTLLQRGAQQLDAGSNYAAIRTFGRALRRLHAHESRYDLVRALYLCANAYERVGLLWAARGTLLVAASIATNDFWAYEDVTPPQWVCYNRLKWIELQLGRMPNILAWHDLDRTFASVLHSKGYPVEKASRGELFFDAIFGILLLRTDLWSLKSLTSFPDVLRQLELEISAAALLYALGREQDIATGMFEGDSSDESRRLFFEQLSCQPAGESLPPTPELCNRRNLTLRSKLLGCRISVEVQNSSPCVELGESLLAALESLLSTGVADRVAPQEPILTSTVRKSDFADVPFSFSITEKEGRPHLEIVCSDFNPHTLSREAQAALKKRLFDVLAHIISHFFLISGSDGTLESIFDEGHAIERSLDYTTSFVTTGNILGHQPKTRLLDWKLEGAKIYSLGRKEEWNADERREIIGPSVTERPREWRSGSGEVPENLRDPEKTAHSDMEVISVIRLRLWDRAGWSGTVFLTPPPSSGPPILAPIFKDPKAAFRIFQHWHDEFGNEDTEERIRVSIIRGVSRGNPHHYRIVVGSNLPENLPESTQLTMVSRIQTMEPSSDENLARFLDSYRMSGAYFLAGASFGPQGPEPVSDIRVLKKQLIVLDAYQVGRHDPEVPAIHADDDPVVPSGTEDAPVLEVLRWLREKQSRR